MKLPEKIYPNCPSCKGEGHYELAGKDWPCTWCKIEYKRETCQHQFVLNSTIKFTDKQYMICFAVPVKDFEICQGCGMVKNVEYDKSGTGSRCC